MKNHIRRKYSIKQRLLENALSYPIKDINNILLVTEEYKKVGIDYFYYYMPIIRQEFSLLIIEV